MERTVLVPAVCLIHFPIPDAMPIAHPFDWIVYATYHYR